MAKVPNGIETLPKMSIAWVECTNITDRQTDRRQTDGQTDGRQTDGRAIAYSECNKLSCNLREPHAKQTSATTSTSLPSGIGFPFSRATLSRVAIALSGIPRVMSNRGLSGSHWRQHKQTHRVSWTEHHTLLHSAWSESLSKRSIAIKPEVIVSDVGRPRRGLK